MDNDRGKFEFNSEQHLRPILAQVSSDNSTKDEKKVDKDQLINGISIIGDHHDILLKVLFLLIFYLLFFCPYFWSLLVYWRIGWL